MKTENQQKFKVIIDNQNNWIYNLWVRDHGRVSIDKSEALPGELVTITMSISDIKFIMDYVILFFNSGKWEMTMKLKEKDMIIEKVEENNLIYKCSFIMPTSDVSISAICTESPYGYMKRAEIRQSQNNNQNNSQNDIYHSSEDGYWSNGAWIKYNKLA